MFCFAMDADTRAGELHLGQADKSLIWDKLWQLGDSVISHEVTTESYPVTGEICSAEKSDIK